MEHTIFVYECRLKTTRFKTTLQQGLDKNRIKLDIILSKIKELGKRQIEILQYGKVSV